MLTVLAAEGPSNGALFAGAVLLIGWFVIGAFMFRNGQRRLQAARAATGTTERPSAGEGTASDAADGITGTPT